VKAFERAENIFKFVFLAAVVSTALSATFGVTTLTLTGFAAWDRYATIWFTWWVGDAVGDLLVAPLIVIWWIQPQIDIKRERVFEAPALLVTFLITAHFVFLSDVAIDAEYVVVLPLLWAAFRFGRRGRGNFGHFCCQPLPWRARYAALAHSRAQTLLNPFYICRGLSAQWQWPL
jgi:integral membrane sensor domain MASE1